MESVYVSFGAIILCSISNLILAKPIIGNDKSFSDDKLHCIDSNEGSDYERNDPNSFTDYYRPRSRFDGLERYPNRQFDYTQKRSLSDEYFNIGSNSLQKRQVGVIYKDDKPIGILQPYQRSYRFIPVKEDNNLYGLDANQIQDVSYTVPTITGVDKREINGINSDPVQYLEETYPSILTNFKIVNKLDKKRNYDALTDDNVRDLKATIRRLRSSNPHNSEQIEDELKNILDDMGLIDDEEIHPEKREIITEDQKDDEDEPLLEDEAKSMKDREKRDETCNTFGDSADSSSKSAITNTASGHNLFALDEKKNEIKNDMSHDKREVAEEFNEKSRKKRQKQEMASGINKENPELLENLKDSGDLMVSGNKSPLASSSEITVRDAGNKEADEQFLEDEDNDYEKRVERQIQSKINSLKEEVKREIEALKNKQNEDDIQRKKRQIPDSLADEETDELNPAMHPDGDLKPLVRKRRTVKQPELTGSSADTNKLNLRRKRETDSFGGRKKRRNEHPLDAHSNHKNYKSHHEDSEEGGELLGGEDFEEGGNIKRDIFNNDGDYGDLNHEDTNLNDAVYERGKRSRMLSNLDLYDNYPYNSNYFYDDDNERLKRQNIDETDEYREKVGNNRFIPLRSNHLSSRLRRRINEDQITPNRPQQLSDMSDLDLFGALPKSYDGELSRYKRVKRK